MTSPTPDRWRMLEDVAQERFPCPSKDEKYWAISDKAMRSRLVKPMGGECKKTGRSNG